MEPETVAGRQRLDVHARNLAVRHADHRAIGRTDPRRAQADVVDGPDRLTNLQRVSDADGLVDEDRQPADHVLERLLRGECDGNTADPKAGERRRGIESEIAEA